MTMVIFTGCTNFEPFGMAASVPPSPTGTIGTPVRQARNAAAVEELLGVGSELAGALGEQHQRLAPLEHRLAGPQRLAVGACPASPGTRRARSGTSAPNVPFQSDSLPMYRSRRWVISATNGVSRFERWMGDRMNAPSCRQVLGPDHPGPEVGLGDHDHHAAHEAVEEALAEAQLLAELVALGRMIDRFVVHGQPSSARWASTASTISSTVRSLVSITTASSAARSGSPGPTLVERVASGQVGGDGLVGQLGDLLRPPRGPDLGGGVEVHLELGVGEHDRADVTTLDHATAVLGRPTRAAAGASALARPRVGRHDAHRAGDLRAPDLDGGIDAVHRDRAVVAHASSRSTRDPRRPARRRRVDAPAQRRERDRPVHRPGVEVAEAETAGQRPGHGGLARAGGPVDRDHLHRRRHPNRLRGPVRATGSRTSQKPGNVLATQPGIGDLDARRLRPEQGEAHGHAVVVVGLDHAPAAGRRARSRSRRRSSSASMPQPAELGAPPRRCGRSPCAG